MRQPVPGATGTGRAGFSPVCVEKPTCEPAQASFNADLLLMGFTQLKQCPARHPAWVVVALGCWLLAQVMALSPTLHQWLHADSSSPEHQCAAVLFKEGQIEPASPPMSPVPPSEWIYLRPENGSEVHFRLVEWLPPGRAPPTA